MSIITGTMKNINGDELHPATTAGIVTLSSGSNVEDYLSAFPAISLSETPAPGATPKADVNGRLAAGWLPAGVGVDVNVLNAGSSFRQEISANLALTAGSPRKLAISATTTGLTVSLPDASTLEEDGVSFIIANYGEYTVRVLNYTGGPLGPNTGDVGANEVRAYILMDKASGI